MLWKISVPDMIFDCKQLPGQVFQPAVWCCKLLIVHNDFAESARSLQSIAMVLLTSNLASAAVRWATLQGLWARMVQSLVVHVDKL